MKKILVTGASGQLGQCFRKKSSNFPELAFDFKDSQEFDLTQFAVVRAILREEKYDYCINCAAYTKVEQAEGDREMAFLLNGTAVGNLAEACEDAGTIMIHFSTDYVFDGSKRSSYLESDKTGPLNVYGASKLYGEEVIKLKLRKYYIFRTSWLYSDTGKNFFVTVLNKLENGEELGITDTQEGTPTNAYDLANFVLKIIQEKEGPYGLYHYSNLGSTTWFGFARMIAALTGAGDLIRRNNEFVTKAQRPSYSVLSKQKVLEAFNIPIKTWEESLKDLL